MSSITPNFFVVGAAKAGTTSLYHYLSEHPDIYLSPIKEPHYFCTDIRYENFNSNYREESFIDFPEYFLSSTLVQKHIAFVSDRNDYLALFKAAGQHKAIGEFSTGYLYSKTAAKNILTETPNAKIVMILRNPIERAFSHFLMDMKAGTVSSSKFQEAVAADVTRRDKGWGVSSLYVELGLYYEQVKRYLDIFPPENVKVILFDDFKADTPHAMAQIYSLLGVENAMDGEVRKMFNQALVPRFPKLHAVLVQAGLKRRFGSAMPKTFKKLKAALLVTAGHMKLTQQDIEFMWPFFVNDVKKLSSLLGKDLSKWEPRG